MNRLLTLFFILGFLSSKSQTNVYVGEYVTAYKTSSNKLIVASQRVAGVINNEQYPMNGIRGGHGGQYRVAVFDSLGRVYDCGNATNSSRIGTIEGVWKVRCSFQSVFMLAADSSLYYWGTDHFNKQNGVNITGEPIPLIMPVGRKFIDVKACANTSFADSLTRILALASDGTLWQYLRTSNTATQIPITGVKNFECNASGGVIFTANAVYARTWMNFTDGRIVGAPQTVGTTWANVTGYYTNNNISLPIKELVADYRGMSLIDGEDSLYICGVGTMGEIAVGNNFKFWRSLNYSGDIVANTPVEGFKKIEGKFKNLSGSNTVAPYKWVQDEFGNWYSWGRNKTLSLGNGKTLQPYWGYVVGGRNNGYDVFPNAYDVPFLTKVTPLTQTWGIDTTFNLTDNRTPSVTAGVDRQVIGSTFTLYGGVSQQQPGTTNTITTTNNWTIISGPSIPTIVNSNTDTPAVTVLASGTYVFRNTATNSIGLSSFKDVTIIVFANVLSIDTCTFTYGQWGVCGMGFQTRPYTPTPNGCVGIPPRDSIQRSCTNSIVIKYFYYNTSRKSIRIDCNYPGGMIISNVSGNIIRNVNYQANGQWINVTNLPAGVYFASTYGRSIKFLR